MAKIVDLGQALLPDHVSGAIWGSKTLDPGRSREKRWIRGLPIFFDPYRSIEVLNLRPVVKTTIILLLSRANIKALKDALAHLGPYQTLMSAQDTGPGDQNTVPLPITIQI